jgi:hypothetical protein
MIVALWIALLVLASMTVVLALVVSGMLQAMNELRAVETRIAAFRPKGLPIGAAAPPLTGTTPDGAPFDGALLAGKEHLVAFVSPDCAPCEPLLRDLSDRSVAGDLPTTVLVTGHPGEHANGTWEGLLERSDVVVLTERDQATADRFQTHTTPHVFVVDRDGIIRAQGVANSVAAVRALMGREVGVS